MATEVEKNLGKMYLEEKLTMKQISERTGIPVYTIKKKLHNGGFKKKVDKKQPIPPQPKHVTKVKKERNPELEYLNNKFVIYNGEICELLSKKKAVALLMEGQKRIHKKVAQ